MQLVGTPRHGGCAYAFGVVGEEIAVEQLFEMGEDVFVGFFARDELAVVAVLYFIVYLAHTVDDGIALLQ